MIYDQLNFFWCHDIIASIKVNFEYCFRLLQLMKKVFRALQPILFSGTEYFGSVPDESANFPRSHAGKLVLIRDFPFPRDTMIAAWKYHITIKGTLTITCHLFCLLHICFRTCLDRKFFLLIICKADVFYCLSTSSYL